MEHMLCAISCIKWFAHVFACVIGWSGYEKRLFVFSTEPLASSELLTDNVKSSAVYDKLVL